MATDDKKRMPAGPQGEGDRIPKTSSELLRGRTDDQLGTHGGPEHVDVKDVKAERKEQQADDKSQDGRR